MRGELQCTDETSAENNPSLLSPVSQHSLVTIPYAADTQTQCLVDACRNNHFIKLFILRYKSSCHILNYKRQCVSYKILFCLVIEIFKRQWHRVRVSSKSDSDVKISIREVLKKKSVTNVTPASDPLPFFLFVLHLPAQTTTTPHH